jgi:fructose-1,6-bisphosphatase/inositol monophosphatase family enzyme
VSYLPGRSVADDVIEWFSTHERDYDGVVQHLRAFFDRPTLTAARNACTHYFGTHRVGDVEALRRFAAAFADKRIVAALVDSILADDDALGAIAARSYPHPIGFDKLVLHHDKASGWKLRLHIYWRGNNRAEMERLHLHRFEMASAIISGELTNHCWAVTEFENATQLVDGIATRPVTTQPAEKKRVAAYSGYLRDENGLLHKSFLGNCQLERLTSHTFVSGQAYAQVLDDAHYVETNAETGVSNGDICSTIYLHGASLTDDDGRTIPILFEDEPLDDPDQIISTIPAMEPETLRSSLVKYRDILEQSIEFYDWLYDPKHGRDLSVGMIAGYLIAEHYQNPHVINTWISHESACKVLLRDAAAELERLLALDDPVAGIDRDDRRQRYFAILTDKANRHPDGSAAWLPENGDLVKEMWRYCGAIKGEKPEVTVLKPVWENVVGVRLPGGAHYGHVAAMIEAAFATNSLATQPASNVQAETKADGSAVSEVDRTVETAIRAILDSYYPGYSFFGEETGDDTPADPVPGDKRWLVDPIDGTRNYLSGGDDWCISIACQQFDGNGWVTTDAAISHPATARIYWAERGKGAWVIERDDTEREVVLPATGADAGSDMALAGKLVDVSIKGFGVDAELGLLRDIRTGHGIYRSSGSAGLMLVQVADRGRDAAVITAAPYDVAAGALIAAEAGAHLATAEFARDGYDFTVMVAASEASVSAALKNAASAALQPHGLSDWHPSPTEP